MAGSLSRSALLLCLACWTAAVQAGDPAVVRTRGQLEAVLTSGKATPLDTLTPYGKRSLLRSLHWNEDGILTGLNTWILTRELDAPQMEQVLAYLGVEAYLPMLSGRLDGPAVRLPAPSPSTEEQLDSLTRSAHEEAAARQVSVTGTTTKGAASLLAQYRRMFGERMTPAALRRQPLGELLPLFEAAVTMNFYHPGTALGDLLNVHRELAARGVATVRWFDDRTLDALVAARRFDEAQAFAAGKPALAHRPIPKLADPLGSGLMGRSLLRYDSATNTLTREAAPAPDGLQVVMVVAAGCQPSARALAALREDADLQDRLRQAGLLLVTDPSGSIPLHFISAWNAANPTIPMRATYSLQEWQGAVPAGVPAFFVLHDGKAVDQLRGGWPPEGNKAALIALIEAARDRQGSKGGQPVGQLPPHLPHRQGQ